MGVCVCVCGCVCVGVGGCVCGCVCNNSYNTTHEMVRVTHGSAWERGGGGRRGG